jgi:hypothetical protein
MHNPVWISLLIPIVILSNGLPLVYATELRAYSAEVLGVLIILALATWFAIKERKSALVGLVFLMPLIALLTRYSIVSALGSVAIMFLALWTAQPSRRTAQAATTVVGSVGITVAILFWYARGLERGISGPDYVNELEIANNANFTFLLDALVANFWTGPNIFTGLFLIAGGFAAVRAIVSQAGQRTPENQWLRDRRVPRWFWLYIFVVSYESLSAALSVLGLSPWYAATRWSIGLVSVSIVSAVGLTSMAIPAWRTPLQRSSAEAGLRVPVSNAAIVFVFSFALLRSAVNPQLLHLLSGSIALSVLYLVFDKSLRRITNIEAERANAPSHKDAISRLIGYSGLVILVVSTTWVSLGKLNTFESTASNSPIPMAIERASVSVSPSVRQYWYVHRWLWPSYRMLWETDIRDTMVGPPPYKAQAASLPLIPTDEQLAQSLSGVVTCTPNQATFVLLYGFVDSYPLTLSALNEQSMSRDCIASLETIDNKEFLLRFVNREDGNSK